MNSDVRKMKIQNLASHFIAQDWRLAFAESCTGGLLSSIFVAEAGASRYFMGSVVSYDGSVKERVLHVPKTLMLAMGEVSLPVAQAMAQGVRDCLRVDWGLAITGIAGPSGGTPDKPVGTVCFALIGPGYSQTVTQRFSPVDRRTIQEKSADFAVDFLSKAVLID